MDVHADFLDGYRQTHAERTPSTMEDRQCAFRGEWRLASAMLVKKKIATVNVSGFRTCGDRQRST
jgi:hypothetical protein